jgi:hypothetical protein
MWTGAELLFSLYFRYYTQTFFLFFSFWLLYCLSFLDLQLLITLLVSSSLSSILIQCHLNAWTRLVVARGPHKHMGPMLIYACCVGMFFLMLKHYFVESLNTINIYLILSTIYIFIPVSGC